MGIESANEKVLNSYNKKIAIENFEQAIKILSENNFISEVSFIVGSPEDTLETIQESIDFAEKLKIFQGVYAHISIMTYYNGTPLSKSMITKGFKLNSYARSATNYLSIEDIEKIHKKFYMTFYNPTYIQHIKQHSNRLFYEAAKGHINLAEKYFNELSISNCYTENENKMSDKNASTQLAVLRNGGSNPAESFVGN
jgi:radical SAM superfamily enzyme YgiQ (UPF0313 family)